MRIAIFVIDYPTLNAGISLYHALSRLGHECFLVEAQYGPIGEMKKRTPSDIPTVMFLQRRQVMARKNRIAWVKSQTPSIGVTPAKKTSPDNLWRKFKKARSAVRKSLVAAERKYLPRRFQNRRRKYMRRMKKPLTLFRNKLGDWKFRLNGWYSLNPVNLYRYFTFSKKTRPTNRYWAASKWHSTLVQIFDHGFARKSETRQAERILSARQVDVIIMTHDIETSITVPFFKACRKLQKPVFLYPYSFPEPEASFRRVKDDPSFQINNKQKKLIAKFWPKYVWEQEGSKALYSPVPQTLASIIGGFSLPRPWYIFSSPFDRVFLQSKFFLEQFKAHGFSTDNLSITGAPEHDAFFHVQANRQRGKEKLARHAAFNIEKPVLCVNIGQNTFEGGSENTPIFSDWCSFADYQKKALRRLSKRFNIVLSFHPRLSEEEKSRCLDEKFVVADCHILDALAISDLFLSYSGSSIIPYGIAGQIPVLVFDAHGYHYDTIFDEPGIRVIYKRDTFDAFILKLLQEDKFPLLFGLEEGVLNDNKGVIDGQAGKRIEKILLEYCS